MTRLLLLLGLLATVAAHAEDEYRDPDPWIGVNRVTHRFNDALDRAVLRPGAVGYSKVVPGVIRQRVGNFFANLDGVNDAVNNLLQGKVGNSITDVWRVLINSTVGIGGLFDPATTMGLPDHDEDFGQTFARWGVPDGPYVVLPLMGPSTLRDSVGRLLDGRLQPNRYLHPVHHRNSVYGLKALHNRSDLLKAEGVIFGDKYTFFREAYLQRRTYLINDGIVDDSFGDDF